MSTTEHRWEIRQVKQVERILRRLPKDLLGRIDEKIASLVEDPWPRGCKKLSRTGYDNHYRIRVGEWRISYAIEKDVLIVLILEVAPRGDAYRF